MSAPRPDAPGDAVSTFLTAFWDRHPVTGTFAGATGNDHAYPDWSPEGLDASVQALRAERTAIAPELARAEQSLAHAAWPSCAPLVDLRLADVTLEIELAERSGTHFHRGNPALAIGEAVFGIVSLMLRRDLDIEGRWASVARRVAALPAFLEGAQRSLARRIPAAWRDRALRECEGGTILLREGLPLWFGDRSSDDAPAAAMAAVPAAVAAMHAYAEWLRNDAPIDADNQVAAGEPLLAMLVSRGHWFATPLATWRAELSTRFVEARGRLAGMAGALAPGGWAEVEARLALDVPEPGEYLGALEQCWNDCKATAEAMRFVQWPDAPLRFASTAEWARTAAPYLYYLPYRCPPPLVPTGVHVHEVAPIGVDAAGQAKVSPAMTRAQIKLNHVVHHAALGHHVQNWYAARSASRIGRVAAQDGASRIAMFVGGSLAEGWACYATDLMEEAGFLTPMERVAEQHTRLRLLARAMMDIDLHTGQRSLDEVARFYALDVGMGDAAARNEAVKNSMFPGAAIMYWLGLDGLHRLRLERAKRDGDAFELQAFHQEILAMGAIPVPMIVERMRVAAA